MQFVVRSQPPEAQSRAEKGGERTVGGKGRVIRILTHDGPVVQGHLRKSKND